MFSGFFPLKDSEKEPIKRGSKSGFASEEIYKLSSRSQQLFNLNTCKYYNNIGRTINLLKTRTF